VLAAFYAGGVALFAPCCIVFLAPGYLALAARNHRWRLLPLTFAFTAGLALVLVPITLGISLVAATIARFHAPLYYAGGTLMLTLAVLALSGRMWTMPRFLRAPDARRGDSASFFAFGVFSGIASSCCAPVLAGVMTLSALSGTPGGGIVLGLAYVFGMVFPLFVMALAWDKLHLSQRRLGGARPVRLHLAGRTLVTSTVNLAVAAGFTAIAGFVFYLAGAGRMTGGPGFQVAIGRALSRLFRGIETWTAPVPEPVLGLALLALAAVFVVAALRGRRPEPEPEMGSKPETQLSPDPDPDPGLGWDPEAAGQSPAAADSETRPANGPAGERADADHHCHAPVRNRP
jgi:cytochrome c biogenesis protein CcdA